jgi:hypothetical protein
MKLDASARTSERYFFVVKPTSHNQPSAPARHERKNHTHDDRNSTKQTEVLQHDEISCHKLHSLLAKLRGQRRNASLTKFTICSSFIITSGDGLPCNTSSIASIPCEDTSWTCISGVSAMTVNYTPKGSRNRINIRKSGRRRRGADNGKSTRQLITSIPQLEIRCTRRKLVDQRVNLVAQSCVFVSLKVGFEVVL